MEEAMKAGLDKEAFAMAKKTCSSLPGKDAPKEPFVLERVLVREVAAANSSIDIPLRGQFALQDDVWTATTENSEEIKTAVQNFLKGRSLIAFGGDTLVMGSSEAIGALESLVSEGRRFISGVQTAQERIAERDQTERLQASRQSATGLVQAAWYALERLSKYLGNIETHRQLIEIAVARGDSVKADLYRSYSKANSQNIEDSASSYVQAIHDLDIVPPDLREQALETLRSQIAVFSIPWKTALLGRLMTDIETPPKFGKGQWMEEIRRLRQQHQQ
jgi:hypothetical protein